MAVFLSNLSRLLLRPLLVLLLSAPVVVLLLSVQTGASVGNQPALSANELSRIEQLLLETAPQSPASASLHNMQLNAEELNLLLRYSMDVMNLSPDWAAELDLMANAVSTELSIKLIDGWIPLFLNMRGEFTKSENLLALDALYIGKLQLPDRFLQYGRAQLRERLQTSNSAYLDLTELITRVQNVAVTPERMDIALVWDPELISRISNQAQQLLISDNDKRRIMDHYRQISDVAATIPVDIRAVSLTTFLVPLFDSANEKSLAGSDPIAENRTLFQALAIYVNNENIAQLLGEELAQQLPPAKYIEVRLLRRQDLAQHLVSIAAITASAGADVAEMLSTTKEAYDARYRSGFSFSDLTANTVGVTLASLSTQDEATALLMQRRLANLQNESDYMPEVGSNRDGLSESDFNAIYSDRNSPEYQRRLAEIRELINARPLFRDL